MKYADCEMDTARNPGGSKTLTGMLLNQINGLKLLQLTSGHVQLQPLHSTCDDPFLVSSTSISEAEVVESVKSSKRRKAAKFYIGNLWGKGLGRPKHRWDSKLEIYFR